MEETTVPEWINDLPDERKAASTLHKFSDVDGLAKGYIELEGWKGNAIRIPGEDAGEDARNEFNATLMARVPQLMHKPDSTSEEQMSLFYDSIGVPKESKGYADVEGLQEETLSRTKTLAHHANLSPDQYAKMSSWLATEQAEAGELMEAAKADNLNAVTLKLGNSTEQRINRIESIARGKGFEVSMDGAPPDIVLYLDSLIDDMQGKGPQGNEINGATVGPNVAELQEDITEIRTRLMTEKYTMPRQEYVALNEKYIRKMEAVRNMT